MSALVSGQGAVFVSETATRSASAAGAFLSETVSTGGPVDFAGDLSFSVPFAADVTPLRDLTGDLTVRLRSPPTSSTFTTSTARSSLRSPLSPI